MSRRARILINIEVRDLTAATKIHSRIFNEPPTRALRNQVDWALDDLATDFSIHNEPRAPTALLYRIFILA